MDKRDLNYLRPVSELVGFELQSFIAGSLIGTIEPGIVEEGEFSVCVDDYNDQNLF